VDLDHLPSELGQEWLRLEDRGRPYPHTGFTVLLAALLALRSRAWWGATLGLAAHFTRDLTDTDSGVRLGWPLSDHEFHAPPALYPLLVFTLWRR
jgi:membrane-bound metal-dependent hydrolase YbcI (DUF457 family)